MNDNHRLYLRRSWIGVGGIACWVLLNPSTADDRRDDATVRRIIGFSKRWGFRGFVLVNLFTFRATDPRDLADCPLARAIGEGADEAIVQAAGESQIVVCAWGDAGILAGRNESVLELLRDLPLYCIDFTHAGNPTHPVRAKYTSAPKVFRS
jgi:hypothetical protein